ncbi:MAG: biopolymer transporter ExbD [Pseudomonadota bacterium]
MRRRVRRRRLSMTSLIDVIFLLLLFFMLSSTFSKFAEVEMSVGGAGAGAAIPDRLAFLRLGEQQLDLNGQAVDLAGLGPALDALADPTLIVSVLPSASAQRLTDLLVELRRTPDVQVVLLGEG